MKIKTFLKIALKSLTPLICLVTFIAALLLFLSFKNKLVFSDEARVYVINPAIDTTFQSDMTEICPKTE